MPFARFAPCRWLSPDITTAVGAAADAPHHALTSCKRTDPWSATRKLRVIPAHRDGQPAAQLLRSGLAAKRTISRWIEVKAVSCCCSRCVGPPRRSGTWLSSSQRDCPRPLVLDGAVSRLVASLRQGACTRDGDRQHSPSRECPASPSPDGNGDRRRRRQVHARCT